MTADLRADLRARLLGLVAAAAEVEEDARTIARLAREALDTCAWPRDPREVRERLRQAAQLLDLVELPDLVAAMAASVDAVEVVIARDPSEPCTELEYVEGWAAAARASIALTKAEAIAEARDLAVAVKSREP